MVRASQARQHRDSYIPADHRALFGACYGPLMRWLFTAIPLQQGAMSVASAWRDVSRSG
jgi:hypothetical protein